MIDEEKLKMYLKEPKEDIAKMLTECNKIIGRLQPQVSDEAAERHHSYVAGLARDNYLFKKHYRRLLKENQELKTALWQERKYRQQLKEWYIKRIKSKLMWMFDYYFIMQNDRRLSR